MDRIVSASSLSTGWHVMSNGSTTRLCRSLCHQQDCHLDHVRCDAASSDGYPTKQSQVLQSVVSLSADNIPVPPVGYPQDTPRVELPSSIDTEDGALSIASSLDRALTSAPRCQDTAIYNYSQYAQANYLVTTSATIEASEDRSSSTIRGQPVQLPNHSVPDPITQAPTPFPSDWPDTTPVNATMTHYEEVAQDRASDHTAYPRTIIPRAAEFPLGYPQGDQNVSRFSEPPSAHHATAGPLAPTAVFPGYITPLRGRADHLQRVEMHNNISSADSNVSPCPSSQGPVTPPLRGSYLSDYLDSENGPTPEERTSPVWFTPQTHLLPNQQTEIIPTHITTHIFPHTPPQSNSNAQVVNLHASASIPPSSSLPVPLPRDSPMHDSFPNIGNGNLPMPAGPPMTNYPPSGSMLGHLKGEQTRSRTRIHHRMKMEGHSRLSERISTRRAGHRTKLQSRTRTRPSAVCPPRDRNVPMCCGWQNEAGELCGEHVTYNNCAEHFAAFHDIRNMAKDVGVLCRWCPLSWKTKITRKNILRHLREVHLCWPRLKKQDCTDANNTISSL